ncbi:hypothetical protein F4679DRAFT_445775 [Xylaria curta]|nr:hypothetical protein F4679DRAFT_445775 [Xylaria curta]
MRVASFLASIAFSCVVQGLAINSSHVARNRRDEQHGYGMMFYSGDNFCGHTSFHHESSSPSPQLAHCQALIKFLNRARKYGDEFIGWDKDHLQSDYAELGTVDSCSIAAKPIDANDNSPAVMTWGDIADILQSAIDKFGDGKLRTSGHITCKVPDNAINRQVLTWEGPWNKRKFEWQIYTPGSVPEIKH